MRAATFDRLAQPKALSGVNRWGGRRLGWAEEVMGRAKTALRQQGLINNAGAGPQGHVNARIWNIAQNRESWAGWINRWYKQCDWRDFARTGTT